MSQLQGTSESPSPVLSHTSWAQCTCKRCTARRRVKALLDGCPCKQCQPGPGLDFSWKLSQRGRTQRLRLKVLLAKNDRGELTPDEETELDGMCHDYLFGG